MKKILLIAAVAAAVSGTTFAANVGVGLGTKESFVEASVLPKTTVGYARVYRDQYGHQNDLYAKYDVMGENLQVLGGWRNHMKGQNNSFYGGARVTTDHFLGFQPYVSYVAGSSFGETNVGVNYDIGFGIELNVNYHKYNPKHGKDESGVGVGASYQF